MPHGAMLLGVEADICNAGLMADHDYDRITLIPLNTSLCSASQDFLFSFRIRHTHDR